MKSPPGSEPGWVSSAYVAYWLPVNLMAAEAPKATKSQPTGLYGLREPTKAPTVAKGTAVERTRGTRATSLTGHSRNPRQIPATIRAQKVQGNHAARRPDSPTPRPCSLAPSVMTPLYSTTLSEALRSAVQRESSWTREAREEASAGAVVATDSASVNADYDNGSATLRGPSRFRGWNGPADLW